MIRLKSADRLLLGAGEPPDPGDVAATQGGRARRRPLDHRVDVLGIADVETAGGAPAFGVDRLGRRRAPDSLRSRQATIAPSAPKRAASPSDARRGTGHHHDLAGETIGRLRIASLDRDGMDEAADRVRERLRRRREEDGVTAVVGAIGSERLEAPVLALRHAHVDEVDDVDRAARRPRAPAGKTSKLVVVRRAPPRRRGRGTTRRVWSDGPGQPVAPQ